MASTKPSARRGTKPSSHQRSSTCTRPLSRSIRGSILPTKRSPKQYRQHVPAPAAPGRRGEELPDVLEAEEGSEEWTVPHQGVERRQERDRASGSGGRCSSPTSSASTNRFPRTPSTWTGTSSPSAINSSRSAALPGYPGALGSGFAYPRPPKMSAPPAPRRPWARYRERSRWRNCSTTGTSRARTSAGRSRSRRS